MPEKLKSRKKRVEILLVEDNPGDASLIKEVLKISDFPIHLNVVRDGEAALIYLFRRRREPNAPMPEIILLDLNLPKKNGCEVLSVIKNDPDLKDIPVLILTSSRENSDIREAYKNNANFFITKPMDINHFSVLTKYIEDFWIKSLSFGVTGNVYEN